MWTGKHGAIIGASVWQMSEFIAILAYITVHYGTLETQLLAEFRYSYPDFT